MIENLDFSKSEQYTLSIRLCADGFSFSVYNPIDNSSFAYMPYRIEPNISLTANIKQALLDNDFLKSPFKRTNILIATTNYTSVPFELFEDDFIESIYYHNHPRAHNEIVFYNILNHSNVAMLFTIDKSTHTLLTEQFPNARIFASISPVMEHFSRKSRLGNSRKLYAYLQKKTIDIIAFDHGRLLFINSFPNRGGSDCSYFILNVWKQLNLDQERDELHLVGNIQEKEKLTDELKKFLKQVYMINPTADFNNSEFTQINDIPYDMQTLLLSNL